MATGRKLIDESSQEEGVGYPTVGSKKSSKIPVCGDRKVKSVTSLDLLREKNLLRGLH